MAYKIQGLPAEDKPICTSLGKRQIFSDFFAFLIYYILRDRNVLNDPLRQRFKDLFYYRVACTVMGDNLLVVILILIK